MNWPNKYAVLTKNIHSFNSYSIIPIRYEDKYEIMNWRNDQISILRQEKLLTKEVQNKYFNEVVYKTFYQKEPEQILFSFLLKGVLIGYGGLVHIDWRKKTAEISFLIKSKFDKINFQKYWSVYLRLIERVAFQNLNLTEIFTFSFIKRKRFEKLILSQGYIFKFKTNEFKKSNQIIESQIHAKKNYILNFRKANINDSMLFYELNNDEITRNNSRNKDHFNYKAHELWFNDKLKSKNDDLLVFEKKTIIGIVRLENKKTYTNVSIVVKKENRGKGYGTKMLSTTLNFFSAEKFKAEIYKKNNPSISIFFKNNFKVKGEYLLNEKYFLKLERHG